MNLQPGRQSANQAESLPPPPGTLCCLADLPSPAPTGPLPVARVSPTSLSLLVEEHLRGGEESGHYGGHVHEGAFTIRPDCTPLKTQFLDKHQHPATHNSSPRRPGRLKTTPTSAGCSPQKRVSTSVFDCHSTTAEEKCRSERGDRSCCLDCSRGRGEESAPPGPGEPSRPGRLTSQPGVRPRSRHGPLRSPPARLGVEPGTSSGLEASDGTGEPAPLEKPFITCTERRPPPPPSAAIKTDLGSSSVQMTPHNVAGGGTHCGLPTPANCAGPLTHTPTHTRIRNPDISNIGSPTVGHTIPPQPPSATQPEPSTWPRIHFTHHLSSITLLDTPPPHAPPPYSSSLHVSEPHNIITITSPLSVPVTIP
ncbi:mucin-2-like [Penaeus indicus]|uniref:mucin-2-like n=1 Tax=Penaeus indicus TaxID=29960 RepID=UPI00300C5487